MLRFRVNRVGFRRFGFSHPHELNSRIGYRGGIRK